MSETVKSGGWRGNSWDLMKENDWRVGDVLESCELMGKERVPLRIKIVKLHSWGGTPLTPSGLYDLPADGKMAGMSGTGGGVIQFCEWPIGGSVHACSLTCRDWKKVA